jgi:hypothetical protein
MRRSKLFDVCGERHRLKFRKEILPETRTHTRTSTHTHTHTPSPQYIYCYRGFWGKLSNLADWYVYIITRIWRPSIRMALNNVAFSDTSGVFLPVPSPPPPRGKVLRHGCGYVRALGLQHIKWFQLERLFIFPYFQINVQDISDF